MRKQLELSESFVTGEPTVQPVVLWTPSGRLARESFTEKTASEATDYIKSVQPKPGTTIALVLALGAYETYDLNQNGDGFNEFAYRPGVKPSCGCCTAEGAWITEKQVVTQHFKSFDVHGKNYRHHVNNDPKKAVGDVLKSFWNPYMHRVELLIGLRNDLAPDLAERIADREYPAVSMGCRIKYDVCTECGHRSPTRKTYCDHLKLRMRQVSPSGLRYGALNPDPVFFDISWVIRPADRTGYMLKKVAEHAYEIKSSAELGEAVDFLESKQAAVRKVADIEKIVRGLPVDHATSPLGAEEGRKIRTYVQYVLPSLRSDAQMDPALQNKLLNYPMEKTLATLQAAGVQLTTAEFVRLFMGKMSPGTQVSDKACDVATALHGPVLDMYAEHPSLLDAASKSEMLNFSHGNVDPQITDTAKKYIEKRAGIGAYLTRKYIPPILREEEAPFTDMLTVTDPATGKQHTTTRGAAIAAHDAEAQAHLHRLLGAAALLRGAYTLTSAGVPMATPLLAAAAMRPTADVIRGGAPQYQTNEGVDIPMRTEMAPERAKFSSDFLLPALGTAALVGALGHDYGSRVNRGVPVHDPNSSYASQMVDQLGSAAHRHPLLSTVAGLGAAGVIKNLLTKHAEDEAPEVLFNKLAEALGSVFAAVL